MLNIAPLLSTPSSFTLLIAPVAWGKTKLLLDCYRESSPWMLYISPLRALCDEFYQRARPLKRVSLMQKGVDKKVLVKKFLHKKKGLLVTTPEMLSADFLQGLASAKEKPLVVLDEFHLCYHWGQSFRPFLWETCMGLANSGCSILGLTATIDPALLEQWKRDFTLGMEQKFVIDIGNHQLSKNPHKSFHYPALFKPAFTRRFLLELLGRAQSGDVLLYFCRYRGEVDAWLEFCRRKGVRALGCKGGEASAFMQLIEGGNIPRVIFCTSTLSHGVNLPGVSKVFISYKVENRDFWIQMIGRGGRRGNDYQLFSLSGPNKVSWREWVARASKVCLYDGWVRVKLSLWNFNYAKKD